MRGFGNYLFIGAGWLCTASCLAASIVEVNDVKGRALTDAVVYLEALDTRLTLKPARAEIAQKDKRFLPLVSVVGVGTAISFPNNDSVRHHAYSFSTAKPFEIKLYSGVPAAPIVFDKAGTVVVGCNIHDQMVAYIHVVNTPFFAKTNTQGQASFGELPAGKYKLKVWHYLQNGGPNAAVYEQDWQAEAGTIKVRLPFSQE